MKKPKYSKQFLTELEKLPNVLHACKTVGISRQTVYRWCKEDPGFEAAMVKALKEGIANMNDITESQVYRMIQDKNWSAVRFWLQHHHPSYKPKSPSDTTSGTPPADELNDDELQTMEEMLAKFMKVKNSRDRKWKMTK